MDRERAEAFVAQMVGILNGGMLGLMISVGHRTGLFDAMQDLPPSDSTQIAAVAGLQERYVREWLGAMVTGRVVDHDAAGGTFVLPAEHAAVLTRSSGPDNLALRAQYIGMLGVVEDAVVDSFRNGGGVPYAEYPSFQTLMAEESVAVLDATLLDVALPLVDGLTDRLRRGIDVADVGCGAGHAVNLMARAFPASNFVGYDFSEEGISAARDEAAAMGLTNARFEVADAATLERTPRFDFITTFDAVHDQAHPTVLLSGIADSLRPSGVYLCVDIRASSRLADNMAHPLGPFLYTISCMHCMTVSLALDGEGLGAVWGEQKARQMLADAGFASVEVKTVDDDVTNNYYIARKE